MNHLLKSARVLSTKRMTGGPDSGSQGREALHRILLAGTLTALMAGTACQSTAPTAVPPQASARVTSNVLSSGDVISMSFPAAPDMNQSQKIRLDGKVTLPMVGELTAAGKTPLVLQEELKAKYAPHLQDSTAIVTLVSSAAVVYVNGAVGGGGKILLDRPMTVFEAIMESGGFSPAADRRKVLLTRNVDGKFQTFVLNLKEGADGGTFYVKPFDAISVKTSWF